MERVTCADYQCFTSIKFVEPNVQQYRLLFGCRRMRGNIYYDDSKIMCEQYCPLFGITNVNKVGSI